MLDHLNGRNGQVDSNLADDPIISELECARYIGVSPITLARMRKAGKIAYVRISDKRLGYRRSTANKLLDARTIHATA
jgi:predicted site-specific integrase-resolvase